MLGYAKGKFGPDDRIEWKQADMTALPFSDGEFDLVVSQFGLMFPPDKPAAMRGALRVLKPGGNFLFSVWDEIENVDFGAIARRTILSYFETNPPTFYDVPFGMYDTAHVRAMLEEAGFKHIETTLLRFPCITATALDAARGFVEGNPILMPIQERVTADVPTIEAAIAREIASQYGDNLATAKMAAHIWSATHP